MMPSSLSMPRFRHGVLLLCLSAAVLALIQSASVSAVGRRIGTQQRHPSLATQYGSLPLIFEPNQGQMDESVAFLARTHGAALFLMPQGTVMQLRDGTEVRTHLAGANRNPKLTGADSLPSRSNYFIGDDPNKWLHDVPNYAKVKYTDVYPGIDLLYYGNQSQLEYDFIVAPGADPKRIALEFEGVEKLSVDRGGNLVVATAGGAVVQRRPVTYQTIDGKRTEIQNRYILRGAHAASFDVGRYDPAQPLIIDPPMLVYSTYLGGSGDDFGRAIAVDSYGYTWVTGETTSLNFPHGTTKLPGLQTTNRGGSCSLFSGDAFVAKLTATGGLVYTTYLGGAGCDIGEGIAVDSLGYAYISGLTSSDNFPTRNPLQPTRHGGIDAFVAKLAPKGSLIYSTYLGGSQDEMGFPYGPRIAVDQQGSAYVAGTTQSTNFPIRNPLQGKASGGPDAFVAKLTPDGSALLYSTYLGGTLEDNANGIAVDAQGHAFVTGITMSRDFPTNNAFQAQNAGTYNTFVTELDSNGGSLIFSTYLGSSGTDVAYSWGYGSAVALDLSGNIYVTGTAGADDFPKKNPLQPTCHRGGDAFVSKLNPTGSALIYSTCLGGSGPEEGYGIAVDTNGNAYVTGATDSTDFPLLFPLQGLAGRSDAFVTKLNPAGALVYSTYLGGNGDENVGHQFPVQPLGAIAVDTNGDAYLTGATSSTNFPTVSPLQASSGGSWDAFVVKITDVPYD